MAYLESFLRIPAHVSMKDQKFYLLAFIGYSCGLLFHLSYSIVFLLLGLTQLLAFNAFSVSTFLFCLILIRRDMRFLPLTNTLSILEIVAHQAICVVLIGWDAGFQYFLILMMVPIFFLPGRNPLKLAQVLICVSCFIVLGLFFRETPPLHSLQPWIITTFHIANISLTCLVIVVWAHYFMSALLKSEDNLEREHEKAERLLHNILPVAIADRLKDDTSTIADGFASVTVVFSDIVGFTQLSSRISPERLVSTLNDVFSLFDTLVEKHGLEKVKTIGDAYMAAAGIPEQRPDHARAVADFALDMLGVLESFNRASSTNLKIRVGINTGAVVAGVIGRKKFIYDLWGTA